MLLIRYLILALLLILASVKASIYIDNLDRKSNISGALIGGLMLAAITSLPELITSISSVIILETSNPNLAFGNVFGSNMFNLLVIGVVDLIFIKRFFLDKVSKTNNKSLMFSMAMATIMLIVFQFGLPFTIHVGSFTFSLVSIFILMFYVVAMSEMAKFDDDGPEDKEDVPSISIPRILLGFSFWAAILVISSIYVTVTADQIAQIYHLDNTFAGALFLGICTSLPELTSTLNLVRLRNYNVAISNCIGSNIFNLAIISVVDIIYVGGNIFEIALIDAKGATTLLYFVLFNSVVLFLALLRRKSISYISYLIPSLIIFSSYIAYMLLSL
ncbi:sodium:calcium antiporter [Haloplasma contractile]|uniref:Na+-Ca+ antiporter CaCA family protein n=1 Tax=Haloplasma contractile SSD-17B TaxID=1033810 RepID=U2FJR1_9MOLU|nr:sodium:calcium antiporter [Haloplasma contractile]ERJ11494.1 Na+-Ca+ antiporter CaCA family protein [Haloplasma contractile SSD-17B]